MSETIALSDSPDLQDSVEVHMLLEELATDDRFTAKEYLPFLTMAEQTTFVKAKYSIGYVMGYDDGTRDVVAVGGILALTHLFHETGERYVKAFGLTRTLAGPNGVIRLTLTPDKFFPGPQPPTTTDLHSQIAWKNWRPRDLIQLSSTHPMIRFNPEVAVHPIPAGWVPRTKYPLETQPAASDLSKATTPFLAGLEDRREMLPQPDTPTSPHKPWLPLPGAKRAKQASSSKVTLDFLTPSLTHLPNIS